MKKLVDLRNITKSFGSQIVLDDLNLYIRENEFLTLLGPAAAGRLLAFGFWAALKRRTRAASYLTAAILPNCPPTSGN